MRVLRKGCFSSRSLVLWVNRMLPVASALSCMPPPNSTKPGQRMTTSRHVESGIAPAAKTVHGVRCRCRDAQRFASCWPRFSKLWPGMQPFASSPKPATSRRLTSRRHASNQASSGGLAPVSKRGLELPGALSPGAVCFRCSFCRVDRGSRSGTTDSGRTRRLCYSQCI